MVIFLLILITAILAYAFLPAIFWAILIVSLAIIGSYFFFGIYGVLGFLAFVGMIATSMHFDEKRKLSQQKETA